MASFSNKLCNPTPFDVKLNWECGINIRIPAFGTANLTMQQMDDFRPGKPGSADIKSTLDYFGLFLLDIDRHYDNQALEALRRSQAAKKQQYNAAVQNIADRKSAAGVPHNPDALEETLKQMGYIKLREEIYLLENAISKFQKAVGVNPERSVTPTLDPARTVFVIDPPYEFPSVAAMEFFLDQNPEIKAKHAALKDQSKGSTLKTRVVQSPVKEESDGE